MPISFEVQGSTRTYMFYTDRCGTCEAFWHRGEIAGGCKDEIRLGEIAAHRIACDSWRLKLKYREAVMDEINKVIS